MPDEPNLNPTQSANVTDPAAPTMTDPQKLVDEALAAPAPPPTAAPILPTEAKTEPTPEVPETEEATVPAELITPPATPNVESLPPSPEPAGAPDTSTSTPPVTEPTPPPTPAETPMTEEMPLAFANSMPAETPKAEETTMPVESTAPVESAAPPVFVPPAPSMTPPVPEKKKGKKMGKVLTAVLGFFLLAGGIVGGYYYYLNNFSEKAEIAAISSKSKDQCKGCSKPVDGGWLKWKNGKCTVTGICNSSKEGKDTPNPTVENAATQADCDTAGGQWCSSTDAKGKKYAFCMENDGSQGNCNDQAAARGYVVLEGIVKCKCTKTDAKGNCTQYNADRTDPAYANSSQQTLSEVDAQCLAQKMGTGAFICKVGVKGYSGGQCTSANGEPFGGSLGCFCGTVQVDTGTGHQSYSSTCGCDEKTTTTTTTPTLVCSGISKDKAAPKIGDQVQFTCAGTVTPAGATNLTYQFQIMKDAGEWTALTATGNKATYTIASAGNYQARCKACGTINNASVCDPSWTGVTP